MVRGNAALSLVRFGDASGRRQIVALLSPPKITAPAAGRIIDAGQSGNLGFIKAGWSQSSRAVRTSAELRSPISGRIRSLFRRDRDQRSSRTEVAAVDPGAEQVWEALCTLSCRPVG